MKNFTKRGGNLVESKLHRLDELISSNKGYLKDGETLIYVKDGKMIATWNDDEYLCEVNGEVNEKLQAFLDWLYDDNKY